MDANSRNLQNWSTDGCAGGGGGPATGSVREQTIKKTCPVGRSTAFEPGRPLTRQSQDQRPSKHTVFQYASGAKQEAMGHLKELFAHGSFEGPAMLYPNEGPYAKAHTYRGWKGTRESNL